MIAPVPIVLREKSHPLLLRLGAFTLHTFAVYLCSGLFALWLVRMWFGVLAPVLHIHTTVRPGDWYLQHLAVICIITALPAGYFNGTKPESLAIWGWVVPFLIMTYEIAVFKSHASVLVRQWLPAIGYYFDVQQTMPSFFADFTRVEAQMWVTAPFWSGLAYSVGALGARWHVVDVLFKFQSGT